MTPFLLARRVARSYGARVALEPTDLDVAGGSLGALGALLGGGLALLATRRLLA